MEEKEQKSAFDLDDLIPDITEETNLEEQVSDMADLLEDENTKEEFVGDIVEDEVDLPQGTSKVDSKEDVEINEANLIPLLAAQLKKEGVLPDDFEITKDIDDKAIYQTYKESVQERVYSEIISEVQNRLTQEGFTEQSLKMAKMLGNGVKVEDLEGLMSYDQILNQKYEGPDDKENLKIVRKFLEETTKSKKVVDRTIDQATLDEDEFKELFEESKEYFKSKKDEEEEYLEQIAARNEAFRKETLRRNQEAIKQTLETGVIKGSKIPNVNKFRDSLTTPTEVVELQGEKRNVSKLGKFLLDFNNDPELQLWAFNQYLFGNEIIQNEKEDSKKEGEVNLLSHFETVRKKGISVKDTPTPKTSGVKSHILKF